MAAQAYCECCGDPIIPGDIDAVCWSCDDRNSDDAKRRGEFAGRAAMLLEIMQGVGGYEKACDCCGQPIVLLPRRVYKQSRSSRWTAWNYDGTRHRDE